MSGEAAASGRVGRCGDWDRRGRAAGGVEVEGVGGVADEAGGVACSAWF